LTLGLLLAALTALDGGCAHRAPQAAVSQPPVVTVSQPIQRQITDFVDFTGRTEAVNAVDVKARVTGYLVKMPFKEGEEVKKGALLFEIDPRPYDAQLDQAKANVQLAKAQLDLATANYARARVISKTPGAISQQDLDTYKANEEVAEAQVSASQATLQVYQLNRDFCEVTSPIDGKISRYYYTLGNLVTQDQTLLTTIVSLDPMYVYFDIDERTVLRVRGLINQGKIAANRAPEEIKVLMGLQSETGYPHEGYVNFINNTVDPFTGTITLRGVFANPLPVRGVRTLSPGMFVRVRVPLGNPHQALLVNDRAIGTDQGLKYVYVVGAENKIEYRRVTLGALQDDGLRVVEDGIESVEWVVVSGLQQVRPNLVVSPEQAPMPIPTAPPSTAPPSTAPAGPSPSGATKPSSAGPAGQPAGGSSGSARPNSAEPAAGARQP
jgi:membrane fusion protein, multidrug efflux system